MRANQSEYPNMRLAAFLATIATFSLLAYMYVYAEPPPAREATARPPARPPGGPQTSSKAGIGRRRLFQQQDAGSALPEPQPGILYVWQLPETGHQTVLVLKVTGPETADCAYLVPFKLRQRGLQPGVVQDAAAARRATELFGNLAGGKLLPAQLLGRTATGEVLADIWLGKEKDQGWLSGQLRGIK